MKTFLIIIAIFFIICIILFIYAIKTAEEYEPPQQDYLKIVYEEDNKTIFYNELTEKYEAYHHGRLIHKSYNKFELMNLFFSEWDQV
jgi:hypothetical protein